MEDVRITQVIEKLHCEECKKPTEHSSVKTERGELTKFTDGSRTYTKCIHITWCVKCQTTSLTSRGFHWQEVMGLIEGQDTVM